MYYKEGVRINRDNFDSVKHVYSLEDKEIFSIQKIEESLYQIESIDNPGKIIILTDDDLQEKFMPIELKEERHVVTVLAAKKIAEGVDAVVGKNPGGLQ